MAINVLSDEEKIKIASSLLRLTSGEIANWRQPKHNAWGDFQLTMGSHVYIFKSKDSDGLQPYVLDIFLETQDISDPWASAQFTIETEPSDSRSYNDEVNELLHNLYEVVYRQVRRPSNAINELMSELEAIERGDLPPF